MTFEAPDLPEETLMEVRLVGGDKHGCSFLTYLINTWERGASLAGQPQALTFIASSARAHGDPAQSALHTCICTASSGDCSPEG